MNHFHFIVPISEERFTLRDLIAFVWPHATEHQREALLSDGVLVDGVTIAAGHHVPDAGARIAFTAPAAEGEAQYLDWPELQRGDGFVLVDKPVGVPTTVDRSDPMSPILFVADELGLDRETMMELWRSDTRQGGPWGIATDGDARADFLSALREGRTSQVWEVLVTRPVFGKVETNGTKFEVSAAGNRDGVSALHVIPDFEKSEDPAAVIYDLRAALADAGAPIVGDEKFGGVVPDQLLRVRLFAMWGEVSGSWNAPPDWWPGMIVEPEKVVVQTSEVSTFSISQASLHFVQHGHPWVLKDADSDRGEFPTGALVRLKAGDSGAGPLALVTNEEPIVARVWGENDGSVEDEIETRFDEALVRRTELFHDTSDLDIFRIIHGEADGFPGLTIDRLGPVVRATVRSACVLGFRDHLYDCLIAFDPQTPLLEVWHSSDVRTQDELPTSRTVGHGLSQVRPGDRVFGREHGLKYWLEVWEGIDPGFFADQRDNRARLLETVQSGERWLNLFCHTGAFSVALASCGATTVNVDLSGRYLDVLRDNLLLNEFDPEQHDRHAEDARAFCERCDETFDGIIVDPPTASSGDAGFWSVKKDYEKLLARCLTLLKPGGVMLACRNERGNRGDFEQLIVGASKRAKCEVKLEENEPSVDYPFSVEFPEGKTFTGFWITRVAH